MITRKATVLAVSILACSGIAQYDTYLIGHSHGYKAAICRETGACAVGRDGMLFSIWPARADGMCMLEDAIK